MSEVFKIECPECGEKFDAGSAFNAHIESTKKQQAEIIKKEAEKKFKSQLESKDKEIDKTKKEAVKKAQDEADKILKIKLDAKDEEIKETKEAAEKKAQKDAEKKFKSQLESKDKEIDKTKKEAVKKAQDEADKILKIKLDAKDKEIEETKKLAEKKVQEQFEKKYKSQLESKSEELEKNKKAQEINESRLTKRIEELNKMVSQGSMELQGEVQEERLQDYLQKIFPEDDIEEISKGAKGGDCIQNINYKDKSNIAQIYFESKDTKTFNEGWANKLLKDMKEKGIANGIIVCSPSCMPTDFNRQKSYVERHGNVITIIPFIKPIVHAVVNRIRSILILKSRENKDHEIPLVMKKFWEILNSPSFILPVKVMVSEIKNMKEQLDKDKTSFLLSLSKKEKTIDNIKDGLTDMMLPLINADRNLFPENILIPQEKVKKLRGEERTMTEENIKPWMKNLK